MRGQSSGIAEVILSPRKVGATIGANDRKVSEYYIIVLCRYMVCLVFFSSKERKKS